MTTVSLMTEKEMSDFFDQMLALENEVTDIRSDMKEAYATVSKKTNIPAKVLRAAVKAAKTGNIDEIVNNTTTVEEVLKQAGRA